MVNLSPKYHASRATLWSFLQYVSGNYPAGIADLVDILKGAHPQDPIYIYDLAVYPYFSLSSSRNMNVKSVFISRLISGQPISLIPPPWMVRLTKSRR